MNLKNTFKAAIAGLILSVSGFANAGPIYSFDQPGNSYTNGSWDFALNFQVLNEITISGLGYYADPFSGDVDSNAVALYDSAQNLLASAIIDNTYDVFQFFRYVTIPDLVLSVGTYQLVGVSNSDNYTWNNINHIFDSNISYISNSWVTDTDGIANYVSGTQTDSQFGFNGANIFIGDSRQFTDPNVVPEPSTLVIFALGLMGLASRKFKKQ